MTTHSRQDKPMANNSQRMALSANKNKNWRANYLRALNIFTPDLTTSTRGRHVTSGDSNRLGNGSGRSDGRRRTAAEPTEDPTRRQAGSNSRGHSAVSSSTASARRSSRSESSSSRSRRGASPSDDKASSGYVFGLRSHLFRARRLASKSDTMVVDRVSAPIEIPTGSPVKSPTAIADKLSERRDSESRRKRGSSNDFESSVNKQPMVQLLSWEEPSVMLGSGGWPLEGDKRNSSDLRSGLSISRSNERSSRPYSRPDGIAEECEDTEDEDADGLTNTEDDEDDDIFKMEFDGEDSGPNARRNVFRGKKDRRSTELRRRPGGLDGFEDDEGSDFVQPLSASFVPPHQMVERGCFSLGLRDELKRKPGVHI